MFMPIRRPMAAPFIMAARRASPHSRRGFSVGGSYRNGYYAAPVPVFQPWPRVPNDIWGTPYYGYVRQPIGHVKIWTSRLGYIYKPIYASPPMESPRPAAAVAAGRGLPPAAGRFPSRNHERPPRPLPTASPNSPPPPPKPRFRSRWSCQPGQDPD